MNMIPVENVNGRMIGNATQYGAKNNKPKHAPTHTDRQSIQAKSLVIKF